MDAKEASVFLAGERIVTCATLGVRGWPHLMPLWYVLRPAQAARVGAFPEVDADSNEGDAQIRRRRPGAVVEDVEEGRADVPGVVDPAATVLQLWSWTYAASQKVRNLERDPRATLQVETGESYEQLRGMMLECDVILHRDGAAVAALGREIFKRYAAASGQPPVAELPAEVAAMVDRQAAKRVALQFVERRRATWDHRKLGGTY
jgi:hypothetical protein